MDRMAMDANAGPAVAVVIPHFQRERGVLRRALVSVLEQDFSGPIHLIVVDDGSPVPAREEAAGLPGRANVEVKIIEQENARCAAARNTGLDAAPASAKYYALLDADDSWSPDHLSRAVDALERGHDFYFSNWIPLGADQDAQSLLGRIRFGDHEKAGWADEMWLFHGSFFRHELEKPIGRVSTTVWRREGFGDLRFHTGFTNCCEDIFFRLNVAKRDPSVVFSSRVEMYSGDGVNTFSGRPWGSLGYFEVARDQLEFVTQIRSRFELAPDEEEIRRSKHREARADAITNVLNLLRRGTVTPFSTIKAMCAADPWLFSSLPSVLVRGLGGRRR